MTRFWDDTWRRWNHCHGWKCAMVLSLCTSVVHSSPTPIRLPVPLPSATAPPAQSLQLRDVVPSTTTYTLFAPTPAIEVDFLTLPFQHTSMDIGTDGVITVVGVSVTDRLPDHGTYGVTLLESANGLVYHAQNSVYSEYMSCALDFPHQKAECSLSESVRDQTGIITMVFTPTALANVGVGVKTFALDASPTKSGSTTSPTSHGSGKSSISKGTLAGIIIAVVIVLIILTLITLLLLRKRRERIKKENGILSAQPFDVQSPASEAFGDGRKVSIRGGNYPLTPLSASTDPTNMTMSSMTPTTSTTALGMAGLYRTGSPSLSSQSQSQSGVGGQGPSAMARSEKGRYMYTSSPSPTTSTPTHTQMPAPIPMQSPGSGDTSLWGSSPLSGFTSTPSQNHPNIVSPSSALSSSTESSPPQPAAGTANPVTVSEARQLLEEMRRMREEVRNLTSEAVLYGGSGGGGLPEYSEDPPSHVQDSSAISSSSQGQEHSYQAAPTGVESGSHPRNLPSTPPENDRGGHTDVPLVPLR